MDTAALDAFMLVLVDSEEAASSVLGPLPFLFQSARRVDLAGLGRGLGCRTRSRLWRGMPGGYWNGPGAGLRCCGSCASG